MMLFSRIFKKKEKKQFKASLVLDSPDIKIVEASYKNKPIFFAIGTSTERDRRITAGGDITGAKGEYQAQKRLKWHLIYNPENMPGFIPIERFKSLMAGITAAVSGSKSVYEGSTRYETFKTSHYNNIIKTLQKKYKHEKLAFGKLRHWFSETEKNGDTQDHYKN
jgi:hypothetical protein